MQSRRHSAVEAVANVAIGYGINFAANLAVLPLFGFHVSATDAAGIGLVFTAISIARSYLLRRVFTGMTERERNNYGSHTLGADERAASNRFDHVGLRDAARRNLQADH